MSDLFAGSIKIIDLLIGIGGFVILYFILRLINDFSATYASKFIGIDMVDDEFTEDDVDDSVCIAICKCPMCGEDVAMIGSAEMADESEWFFTTCDASNGGCGLTTAMYKTPKEALMAWNMRNGTHE